MLLIWMTRLDDDLSSENEKHYGKMSEYRAVKLILIALTVGGL